MHFAGAEDTPHPKASPTSHSGTQAVERCSQGEGGHGRGCCEHGCWQRWCQKTRVQGWVPRPCPSMGPRAVACELADKAGAQARGQDMQAWQQVCNRLAVPVLSSPLRHEQRSPGRWGDWPHFPRPEGGGHSPNLSCSPTVALLTPCSTARSAPRSKVQGCRWPRHTPSSTGTCTRPPKPGTWPQQLTAGGRGLRTPAGHPLSVCLAAQPGPATTDSKHRTPESPPWRAALTPAAPRLSIPSASEMQDAAQVQEDTKWRSFSDCDLCPSQLTPWRRWRGKRDSLDSGLFHFQSPSEVKQETSYLPWGLPVLHFPRCMSPAMQKATSLDSKDISAPCV